MQSHELGALFSLPLEPMGTPLWWGRLCYAICFVTCVRRTTEWSRLEEVSEIIKSNHHIS